MSEIVKLYNPANAAALTPQQIEGLQTLTSEQIKELAKAYPNMTMQRAYLLIIDSKSKLPKEKQLPTLSTFENLWNLRERNGLKSYVAIGFRGQVKQKPNSITARPKKSVVVDLSDQELLTLPGFKMKAENGVTEMPAEKVKVTKVKKAKIQ